MPDWRRILVATDFSPSARVALRSAVAVARQIKGTVEVVHVTEPLPARYKLLVGSFATPDEERAAWAERHLDRLLRRLKAPQVAVESSVRRGRAWEEILEAADDVDADLICLGNSGHSPIQRLLLGSTAENVVRRSSRPVLVTRRHAMGRIHRIVVPVDFDDVSLEALRFAHEAFPRAVAIEAVYVLPPPPPVPELAPVPLDSVRVERELRKYLSRAGVRGLRNALFVHSDPASEIIAHARRRRADLVILSTHGRRGLPRFLLGSVAEKVLRHCASPVLVLPTGAGAERRRRSTA